MAETARAVETTVRTAEAVGTHPRVGTVVRLIAGIATRTAPLVTEAAIRVEIVGLAAGKGTAGTDRRHGTAAVTAMVAVTGTVPLATTDVPAGSGVAHAELVASAPTGSLAVIVTSEPIGRQVATDPVGRTDGRGATGRIPGTATLAVEIAMPGAGKALGMVAASATVAATAVTGMTGEAASVVAGREVTDSGQVARTRARASVRVDRARVVATGTAVTAMAAATSAMVAATSPGDGTASTGMTVARVVTMIGTLEAAATGMAGAAVVTRTRAVIGRTPARVTSGARAVTEADRVPGPVAVTTGAVATGARVATGAVRGQVPVTTGAVAAVVVVTRAAVTKTRLGAAVTAVAAVTGAARVLAARAATAAAREVAPPATPGAVVATGADRPGAEISGAAAAMADGRSVTTIAETSAATGVRATGDRTVAARAAVTVAASVRRTVRRTVRLGAARRRADGRRASVPNAPVSTRTVVVVRLGRVLAVRPETVPTGDRVEQPVIRVAGIGASGVTVRGSRSTRPGNRPVRPFRTRSSPRILTVPSGQSCCPWPSRSRRRSLGTWWRRDS